MSNRPQEEAQTLDADLHVITHDGSMEVQFVQRTLWANLAAIRDSGLLAQMTEADAKVLFVLSTRAKGDTCDCWPSYNSIQRDTGLCHGAVVAAVQRLATLCLEVGRRRVRCRDGRTRDQNSYVIVGPKRGATLITRKKRPNTLPQNPVKSTVSTQVDASTRVDGIHSEDTHAVHAGGRELRSLSSKGTFEVGAAPKGETAKVAAEPPQTAPQAARDAPETAGWPAPPPTITDIDKRIWNEIPKDFRVQGAMALVRGAYKNNAGAVKRLTAVASGVEYPASWVIGDIHKLWRESQERDQQ